MNGPCAHIAAPIRFDMVKTSPMIGRPSSRLVVKPNAMLASERSRRMDVEAYRGTPTSALRQRWRPGRASCASRRSTGPARMREVASMRQKAYRSVQVPRDSESAHPRRGDDTNDGHGDERSEENCVMGERRWRRDRNMHSPFLRIIRPAKVVSNLWMLQLLVLCAVTLGGSGRSGGWSRAAWR
jgi:hypothetical protein